MIPRLIGRAIAVTEAETEIRQVVRNGFLLGVTKVAVNKQVQKVIQNCVKQFEKDKFFVEDTIKSLNAFANRIWRTLSVGLVGQTLNIAKALYKADKKGEIIGEEVLKRRVGLPQDTYIKTYMKSVKRVMGKLADFQALDPEDKKGRNSLRNKAEMTARDEYHENEIADFKAEKVKLVVCSVHSDCSKRCAPWQGKIYSLDGTSGMIDGKKFQPLEKATDIYVTTKKGRTWKNGLLGFNCRHKLYKYTPNMQMPKVSERERKAEYKITEQQREYERQIRDLRAKADMSLDKDERASYRAKAAILNKKYEAFSRKNERAFYPDRTRIA